MSIPSLTGGEAYVLYSAITFRSLLDSLARPGTLNQLAYPPLPVESAHYLILTTPTGVPVNMYALGALSTLLDGETSFILAADGKWLDHDTPAVQWLSLKSSAQSVSPGSADFALLCDGQSSGLLRELFPGTLLEPELSATAISCVEELRTRSANDLVEEDHRGSEESVMLALSGPGIQSQRVISVQGLDARAITDIQAARGSYPLGIDIYFIDAAGRCAGLPRTTNIHTLQGL